MKSFHIKSGIYSQWIGLLLLTGLFGFFMVLSSCNKNQDHEDPPLVMDAQSEYNIELQEQHAATFNLLLNSLDTIQVADSILKLLLNDPHVVSGNVVEQAIFVNYSNGTRGGIFFDPQDSPEMEFPFPEKKDSGSKLKGAKTIPGSKRTILINPHYFERKEYTNPLLETYDNLFPGIGYELPERYLDEECTLELFTRLENYGYIHIYSHGVRFDDDVYLKTGESPNANSHATYSQFLSDGQIVCLTSIADSITKYYMLPEFIADNNFLGNNKPLVYGGYCYGFLGGWPEMFEYIGASGYFSFDWAVRTERSANWAKNIITYLTDYSVEVPYSAWWWMTSSPVEKTYWAANHNKNVSIHYKGLNDLALWNWALPGYSSANISLQVNGTFEDSEGEITNEIWEIPLSAFMQHSVTFAGNSYSSSWHNELFFDRTRSGDLEVIIRPDGKELTYFSFNDTVIPGTSVYHYKYKIKLAGLPLVLEDNEKAIFELTGTNACNAIEQLEYRTDYISGYTNGWKMMTSYNCSSPEPKVSVIMYK